MTKQKRQVRQEVQEATRQVLLKSTKKMPQNQSEPEEESQLFSKKDLLAALKRVENRELTSQQRRDALNVYMIMKNSKRCSSNPSYQICKNERSTFIGDDIDYAYPFSHRYDEPFSDRGASDE